jgi:acylphosphatase
VKVRAHVLVTGDVQGVFFRSGTRNQANLLNLTGWIRNLSDGRVEVVAEGQKDDVEAMVEFCRKGPPGARVDDVEITWEKPTGNFKEFEIRV